MKNDTKILEELIGMSIPVEEFETEIGKVMKKRSSAHLYYSNKPDCILWIARMALKMRCC